MNLQWGTPDALRALLCELVGWQSITESKGEQEFALKLYSKLEELPYFRNNANYLQLGAVEGERHFVTALYHHPSAKDTIVLISHFDTVNTEEYGELEDLATNPEQLTKILHEYKDELPLDAQKDLESGSYLFGRGTMDMKAGLAIHMSLIEKAIVEEWPLNILLLTVPDEEVNSAGMRAAVIALNDIREQYSLEYQLFLNGEPVFSLEPSDSNYKIYSGSIGKIMPSALFYGKESHVGEPLSGMTANYIASFLTQLMEWNPVFQENVLGENTPLPVSLQQKDLKLEYSTQTPYRAVSLYNTFIMERSASEIMDIFEGVAIEAAKACNKSYQTICQREKITPIGEVRVMRYAELLRYATEKLGEEFVLTLTNEVILNNGWDDREKSLRIADSLLINCQELTPAIVTLFTPPYYPAVNSSDNHVVKRSVEFISRKAQEKFGLDVKQVHFFNGISDLSYVNYDDTNEGWTAFEKNTPVWKNTYSIPFSEMKKLRAPVLNIGPYGKDAHKRTERLHIKNAFEEIPVLLAEFIKSFHTIYVNK